MYCARDRRRNGQCNETLSSKRAKPRVWQEQPQMHETTRTSLEPPRNNVEVAWVRPLGWHEQVNWKGTRDIFLATADCSHQRYIVGVHIHDRYTAV